jgi:hypothetical protein
VSELSSGFFLFLFSLFFLFFLFLLFLLARCRPLRWVALLLSSRQSLRPSSFSRTCCSSRNLAKFASSSGATTPAEPDPDPDPNPYPEPEPELNPATNSDSDSDTDAGTEPKPGPESFLSSSRRVSLRMMLKRWAEEGARVPAAWLSLKTLFWNPWASYVLNLLSKVRI